MSYEVVSALDINPVASSIYRQNFPTTRLICKCLTVSCASRVLYFAVLTAVICALELSSLSASPIILASETKDTAEFCKAPTAF